MASVSSYPSLLLKGKTVLDTDDFTRLERDIDEVDPANPNAGTLSISRRTFLIERIKEFSQRVERELNPGLHTIQKGHIEAIQEIQGKIAAGATPKAFYSQLKRFDASLLEKIYKGVWIVSGCPSQDNFSAETIRKDYSVLKQVFPPFFSSKEGTILEQIVESLSNPPTDVEWGRVFQGCLQEKIWSHKQLKAIYRYGLPPSVQPHVPQPPYFGRGFDSKLYMTLGAHFDRTTGMTVFRVFAPRATEVVLHLSESEEIEHRLPFVREEKGVWSIQTSLAPPGRSYHFMIVGPGGGEPVKKVDPFSFGNVIHVSEEGTVDHDSVVVDRDFTWTDDAWLQQRVQFDPSKQPMTIYEVHAPSWKKKENGDLLNWKELAPLLAEYCREIGYTHVELMGVFEHPAPISMGYQITNYFCVNSRMGTLKDFQWFVNYMHEQKIGVILDWVPVHFANDEFALKKFDGTAPF